jgi:hypothetical protein
MKKYACLFILITYFSCQDPDPDLSSEMVGNYYLTETTADSVMNTVWRISSKDRQHVNLEIEIKTGQPGDSLASKKELFLIDNILVNRRRGKLDFANDFIKKNQKYSIVGHATLSAGVITSDAVIRDLKGSEEHWAKVLIRQ